MDLKPVIEAVAKVDAKVDANAELHAEANVQIGAVNKQVRKSASAGRDQITQFGDKWLPRIAMGLLGFLVFASYIPQKAAWLAASWGKKKAVALINGKKSEHPS